MAKTTAKTTTSKVSSTSATSQPAYTVGSLSSLFGSTSSAPSDDSAAPPISQKASRIGTPFSKPSTALAPPRKFNEEDYKDQSLEKKRKSLKTGDRYEDEDGLLKVKGGKKKARVAIANKIREDREEEERIKALEDEADLAAGGGKNSKKKEKKELKELKEAGIIKENYQASSSKMEESDGEVSDADDDNTVTTTDTTATTETTTTTNNSTTNTSDNTTSNNTNDDPLLPQTIFVGNLPSSITTKSLKTLFNSLPGGVLSARLRSLAYKTGVKLPEKSKGDIKLEKKVAVNDKGGKNIDDDARGNTRQGYVVFKELGSVAIAIDTMNDKVVEGRRIKVDSAIPTIEDASDVVFVGGLPFKTDEESLRVHFEELGVEVKSVRVIRDPETQKCKGIAYVTVKDGRTGVAEALTTVNGTTYLKKELRLEVCGKRTKGKKGEFIKKNVKPGFEGRRGGGSERRVLGKMKKKGIVGEKTKSVQKRKSVSAKSMAAREGRANAPPPPPAGKSAHGGDPNKDSKRKASEKKTNDRVKKLEKRVSKGMGANKANKKAAAGFGRK